MPPLLFAVQHDLAKLTRHVSDRYVYTEREGDVSVEKMEFRKAVPP